MPSSQNIKTGAASQTLLTEVKLHMYVICDADYTSFVANEGKRKSTSYKQLLDEVSVISKIIKFKVSVINQRSRMISLTRPRLFCKSQKPNLTIVF